MALLCRNFYTQVHEHINITGLILAATSYEISRQSFYFLKGKLACLCIQVQIIFLRLLLPYCF